MCFSALEILMFHLWVTVFRGSQIELYIRKTAYIGVDIFFLLSVYSLASRKITDLKAYYFSRFKSVYFKFLVFTLIASVVGSFGVSKTVQILLGIELFKRGGGAFLWFLPAIVILYIVFPLIQKWADKAPFIGAIITLAVWFILGVLVCRYTSYRDIFIFWNRIPIMVCGYLMAIYSAQLNKFFERLWVLRPIIALCLIGIGIVLLFNFGFNTKLSKPIQDLFYVTAIPLVLGLVLLLDYIPEVKIISLIGSATLEMYAIQMIWGFNLAGKIYKACRNAALTNLLSVVIVTILSIIASKLFALLFARTTNSNK